MITGFPGFGKLGISSCNCFSVVLMSLESSGRLSSIRNGLSRMASSRIPTTLGLIKSGMGSFSPFLQGYPHHSLLGCYSGATERAANMWKGRLTRPQIWESFVSGCRDCRCRVGLPKWWGCWWPWTHFVSFNCILNVKDCWLFMQMFHKSIMKGFTFLISRVFAYLNHVFLFLVIFFPQPPTSFFFTSLRFWQLTFNMLIHLPPHLTLLKQVLDFLPWLLLSHLPMTLSPAVTTHFVAVTIFKSPTR